MDLMESSILKASGVMFLVLLVGLLTGLLMNDARTDYIQDQIRQNELQTETFIVSQNYLEGSSQNYCRLMGDRIPEIAEQNAQIGRDLQAFSSKSIRSDKEYKYLKKDYYVNQLRLYMMLEDYKSRCNTDTNLVLFFFDEDTASKRQGAVLTEYRRKVENDTYVFSYNLDSNGSEILEMLKTDFGIEDGPVMVINGSIYREYRSLAELKRIMRPEELSGTFSKNGSSS